MEQGISAEDSSGLKRPAQAMDEGKASSKKKKARCAGRMKERNDDDDAGMKEDDVNNTSKPAAAAAGSASHTTKYFPIQSLPADLLSRSASMLPYSEQMDHLCLTNKMIRASVMGMMRRAAYSGPTQALPRLLPGVKELVLCLKGGDEKARFQHISNMRHKEAAMLDTLVTAMTKGGEGDEEEEDEKAKARSTRRQKKYEKVKAEIEEEKKKFTRLMDLRALKDLNSLKTLVLVFEGFFPPELAMDLERQEKEENDEAAAAGGGGGDSSSSSSSSVVAPPSSILLGKLTHLEVSMERRARLISETLPDVILWLLKRLQCPRLKDLQLQAIQTPLPWPRVQDILTRHMLKPLPTSSSASTTLESITMRLDCANFLLFLQSMDDATEAPRVNNSDPSSSSSSAIIISSNPSPPSSFLPALRKVGIKIHGSFNYEEAIEALVNDSRGSRLIVGTPLGKKASSSKQQQALMKSVQVMTKHIRSSVQGNAGGRAGIHANIWTRGGGGGGGVDAKTMILQRQAALLVEAFGPGASNDVTHGVIDLLSEQSGRTLPVLSVLEGLETLIKEYPTPVLQGINARANEVAEAVLRLFKETDDPAPVLIRLSLLCSIRRRNWAHGERSFSVTFAREVLQQGLLSHVLPLLIQGKDKEGNDLRQPIMFTLRAIPPDAFIDEDDDDDDEEEGKEDDGDDVNADATALSPSSMTQGLNPHHLLYLVDCLTLSYPTSDIRRMLNLSVLTNLIHMLGPSSVIGQMILARRETALARAALKCLSVGFVKAWGPCSSGGRFEHPSFRLLRVMHDEDPEVLTRLRDMILADDQGFVSHSSKPKGILLCRLIIAASALDPTLSDVLSSSSSSNKSSSKKSEGRKEMIASLLDGVDMKETAGLSTLYQMEVGLAFRKIIQACGKAKSILLSTYHEVQITRLLLTLPVGEDEPIEAWATLKALYGGSVEAILEAMWKNATCGDTVAAAAGVAAGKGNDDGKENLRKSKRGKGKKKADKTTTRGGGGAAAAAVAAGSTKADSPCREMVTRALVAFLRRLPAIELPLLVGPLFKSKAGITLMQDVAMQFALTQTRKLIKVYAFLQALERCLKLPQPRGRDRGIGAAAAAVAAANAGGSAAGGGGGGGSSSNSIHPGGSSSASFRGGRGGAGGSSSSSTSISNLMNDREAVSQVLRLPENASVIIKISVMVCDHLEATYTGCLRSGCISLLSLLYPEGMDMEKGAPESKMLSSLAPEYPQGVAYIMMRMKLLKEEKKWKKGGKSLIDYLDQHIAAAAEEADEQIAAAMEEEAAAAVAGQEEEEEEQDDNGGEDVGGEEEEEGDGGLSDGDEIYHLGDEVEEIGGDDDDDDDDDNDMQEEEEEEGMEEEGEENGVEEGNEVDEDADADEDEDEDDDDDDDENNASEDEYDDVDAGEWGVVGIGRKHASHDIIDCDAPPEELDLWV